MTKNFRLLVLVVVLVATLGCASDPGRVRSSVPEQMTTEEKVESAAEIGLMFFLSTIGMML